MHAGVRMLWHHRTADVLSAPGAVYPRQRFVIDAVAGHIVMPLPGSVVGGGALTLCVPEDHEGATQALCDVEAADESRDGRAIDRWQAYHGAARGVMARLHVTAVKFAGEVIDDDRVDLRSPIAGVESALVRRMNRDSAHLALVTRRVLGVDLVEPRVVGVDPVGVDVRTRVGVVRVEFGGPVRTASEAEAAVEALLGSAR